MDTHSFTVNTKKAQHLYNVKNDNTSLDKFVKNLKNEFGDIFNAVSVLGFSGGKNEFEFKQLSHGFLQKPKFWESDKIDNFNVRPYYLKLYVNFEKFPFRVCNMDWFI